MSIAKLDQQLCFALYAASHRLTGIYRLLLEPLGLTYTQFIVLMALWETDGIPISQLAKKTALTKATMSPLLKRLEEKGLINRVIPVDNERQKNIELTEAGRNLSIHSVEITKRAFSETGLTKQEAKTVIELCNRITVK